MSKCDIEITFDRPNAVYAAGEQVHGRIRVRVNKDVTCNGVIIEHYWHTHGRGNRATGPKEQRTAQPGNLQMGDDWTETFSFTAPNGPPTYHGHYLNVDHIVHVRVDVPWSIDPTASATYLLATGQNYIANPSEDPRQATENAFEKHGFKIALGMLVAGCICIFPFGIVLIPASFVVMFFALRKSFAEKKLGVVELSVLPTEIPPGTDVAVSLAFTPRRNLRIRRITGQLVGKEVCVSGSGTNTTTHTHKLHEQFVELSGAQDFVPMRTVRLAETFRVPKSHAYSFVAPSNKLQWILTVRIDLPIWPDWVSVVPLIVAPRMLDSSVVEAMIADGTDVGLDAGARRSRHDDAWPTTASEERELVLDAEAWSAPTPVPVDGDSVRSERELLLLLERLHRADRFGSARENLVTEVLDDAFRGQIEIDDNMHTFGSFFDDRYRDGRTIRGRLRGTDYFIEVQCLAERTPEIQDLRSGDFVDVVGIPTRWDPTFDRLVIREQP